MTCLIGTNYRNNCFTVFEIRFRVVISRSSVELILSRYCLLATVLMMRGFCSSPHFDSRLLSKQVQCQQTVWFVVASNTADLGCGNLSDTCISIFCVLDYVFTKHKLTAGSPRLHSRGIRAKSFLKVLFCANEFALRNIFGSICVLIEI